MHKDKTGIDGTDLDGLPEAVDDAELRELEAKMRSAMQSFGAAQPGEADTQRLIAQLQPEFDLLREETGQETLSLHDLPLRDRPSLGRYWLRMAGTLGKSFWLANAAVFIMLTLILKVQSLREIESLFSMVMPLFMMVCIGYGYRTWNRQMREVESITPFPPALQMLSRLLMAVAVNMGFGLASSFYLGVSVREFQMLPFLLSWLSEMVLVGGVLAAVLFYKGLKAGFAAGTLVWLFFQTTWWPKRWMAEQSHSSGLIYGIELAALAVGIAMFLVAYRKCMHIRWMDPS